MSTMLGSGTMYTKMTTLFRPLASKCTHDLQRDCRTVKHQKERSREKIRLSHPYLVGSSCNKLRTRLGTSVARLTWMALPTLRLMSVDHWYYVERPWFWDQGPYKAIDAISFFWSCRHASTLKVPIFLWVTTITISITRIPKSMQTTIVTWINYVGGSDEPRYFSWKLYFFWQHRADWALGNAYSSTIVLVENAWILKNHLECAYKESIKDVRWRTMEFWTNPVFKSVSYWTRSISLN